MFKEMAMMKRMAVVAVMAAMYVGGTMQAQQAPAPSTPVKFTDDLFAGTEKFAKNAVSATEVTMDPQTLGLVDGKDKDRARETKLSVVRTYSYDKPGMYDMAEVEAYRNKLSTGDWHCSVRTRDLKTGASSDICNRSRTDGLWESAIMTVDPKHLTFIHTIRTRPASSGYSIYNGGGWQSDFDMDSLRLAGPEMDAERAAERAERSAERAAARATMSADVQPHVHVDLHDLRLPQIRIDMHGPQAVPAAPVAPAAPAEPAVPALP
jgi:hypothetical protein